MLYITRARAPAFGTFSAGDLGERKACSSFAFRSQKLCCLCVELSGVQVAKDNEVLVAISNRNYARPGEMLDSWMRTVKGAGVTNALIVALDEDTKSHAESQGFTSIIMDLKASALSQSSPVS